MTEEEREPLPAEPVEDDGRRYPSTIGGAFYLVVIAVVAIAIGIVTTGKGVTVHTRECQTLETFAATPERFIDVDWELPEGKDKPAHTGRISAIAVNQPGALASLTNAIAKHDGAVTNLKITNRQQDFFEVLVDVEVRDLRHLGTVIAGLRAASGVTQVERARG